MKKKLLICLSIAFLAVAVILTVANKDMLFGEQRTQPEQKTTATAPADKETKVTLESTCEVTSTTKAPSSTAPQTTASGPTATNPSFVAENITGAPDPSAKTFTAYKPLPSVAFSVSDPSNSRGLPTACINHSFGVASGGKPHHISVSSQDFFDSKGYNAVTYDNKSSEKVLYLTFDCGYENGYTSKVLDTLKAKNVSAAFFCTLDHIEAEPKLIARMIKEGHIVGNHSTNHPNFSTISRTRMAEEIEECDNYLREQFGYTSPYFRFPEGAYSENALELVESLGYKSVFWSLAYADWNTSSQKGAQYAFNTVTARLHPGAIILLHSVSADNAQALGDIIDYALEQGYVFKPLTALP